MHLTKDKKFLVPDKDYYSRWGANYEQKQFKGTMKHIFERGVALDCGAIICDGATVVSILDSISTSYFFNHCPQPRLPFC